MIVKLDHDRLGLLPLSSLKAQFHVGGMLNVNSGSLVYCPNSQKFLGLYLQCGTCVQQQGLSEVPLIFATSTEPGHSLKGVFLLLLQANRADPRESNQQEVIYNSVLVCLVVFYALSDFCVENSSPTLGTIVGRSFFSQPLSEA